MRLVIALTSYDRKVWKAPIIQRTALFYIFSAFWENGIIALLWNTRAGNYII